MDRATDRAKTKGGFPLSAQPAHAGCATSLPTKLKLFIAPTCRGLKPHFSSHSEQKRFQATPDALNPKLKTFA